MKALILGAGRGTRVQPITHSLPKPMMPVLNRPIMELLVEHLRHHGVRQILVNTSYLSGEIENYFRDGARFGVEIGYSFEGRMENGHRVDAPVGSAGAIRKIQDHSGFFDEPFFVLCGDAIIDLDLTRFAEFHHSRGAVASLAMLDVPRETVGSYGVVVAEPDGRILGFQEKPAPEEAQSTTVNPGVYLFEPSVTECGAALLFPR
jgi:mannose-1-phosphate guanylyltransferase